MNQCDKSILLQKCTFENTDNITSAVVRVYTVAQPKFVDVLISCLPSLSISLLFK